MAPIRPAEPADAEAAVDVLRRSITELCVDDHQGDIATIEAWLANKTPENFVTWIQSDDYFCVVADDEGIVGVGLLHRNGEVCLCYVAPGAQGRGLGKGLHDAMEERARAWGIERLVLQSTVRARSFYEGLGYNPAGAMTSGFGITCCYPYAKVIADG